MPPRRRARNPVPVPPTDRVTRSTARARVDRLPSPPQQPQQNDQADQNRTLGLAGSGLGRGGRRGRGRGAGRVRGTGIGRAGASGRGRGRGAQTPTPSSAERRRKSLSLSSSLSSPPSSSLANLESTSATSTHGSRRSGSGSGSGSGSRNGSRSRSRSGRNLEESASGSRSRNGSGSGSRSRSGTRSASNRSVSPPQDPGTPTPPPDGLPPMAIPGANAGPFPGAPGFAFLFPPTPALQDLFLNLDPLGRRLLLSAFTPAEVHVLRTTNAQIDHIFRHDPDGGPFPGRCDNRRRPPFHDVDWRFGRPPLPPPHLTTCDVPPELKQPILPCQGHLYGLEAAVAHGPDHWVCHPCALRVKQESRIDPMWIPFCRECSSLWRTTYPEDRWHCLNDCQCERLFLSPDVLCYDCHVEMVESWWLAVELRAQDLPPYDFNIPHPQISRFVQKAHERVFNEECHCGCVCGKSYEAKLDSYRNPVTGQYDATIQVKICLSCYRERWTNRTYSIPQ